MKSGEEYITYLFPEEIEKRMGDAIEQTPNPVMPTPPESKGFWQMLISLITFRWIRK